MITMAHVMALTAQTFEIELAAFVSSKNSKQHKLEKWIAIALCRQKLGVSQQEVADACGWQDHSSISYAEKHLPEHLKNNPLHRQLFNSIGNQIDILNDISEREAINVLDVAYRVVRNPKRAALTVNVHETYALSRMVIDLFEVAQASFAMAEKYEELEPNPSEAVQALAQSIKAHFKALTTEHLTGEEK